MRMFKEREGRKIAFNSENCRDFRSLPCVFHGPGQDML